MTRFGFDIPAWMSLLGIVPVVFLVAARAHKWRQSGLDKLADQQTQANLLSELNSRRRQWKTTLIAMTGAFAVLALCRPTWDRTTPVASKGRDIIVLLDVSRSMHAEDLSPSRREVAKSSLVEFAGRLRSDRVGLIAFAGSAALRCPLTSDYDFFRAAVEGASPDSVTLGGTEIAKAIRFAIQRGFDDLSERSKHLLLITDAEDHGLGATAAAAEASRKGIRLDVIGLGNGKQGARIPLSDSGPIRYLTYQGQEVWSKLNEPEIRNLADAGSGNALIIGEGKNADLGAGIDRLISGSRGKPVVPRVQGFWIPLALAAVCLSCELSLSERRAL